MNIDKAGKSHWDHAWEKVPSLNAVDPHVAGLGNYINRKYHRYFQNAFTNMNTKSSKLLEIGCATSQWLPYFAREFGFEVTGIDYSEIGCIKAREILSSAGVMGEVINTDLFNPPATMIHAYDVVVSFGVVEHFEDTVGCMKAFAKYLRSGGLVITCIPNMAGMVGSLQKMFDRQVFDKHMALDVDMLQRAHDLSGFNDVKCDYFLSTYFGVVNLSCLDPEQPSARAKAFLARGLRGMSKVVWKMEEWFGEFSTSKILSPYIICRGRKVNSS